MVHALKEAWRVLMPMGVMLDIRPLSVDTPLEVVFGKKRELAGIVDMSPEIEYDIAADKAINTVVKERNFTEDKIDYFDYVYYWKTFHGMMADFEERWKDEIIITDEVIQRAKSLYEEMRPKVKFRFGMRMKLGKYEKNG
jgi:hypothetical protein